MPRDSFVFYRSFFESIISLPEDNQLKLFQAVAHYSLDATVPSLSGVEKAIFTLMKPQLDANNRKFENGKKGGRKANDNQTETKKEPLQKQSETESESENNQNSELTRHGETKAQPNANVNVNVNENVNVNDNVNEVGAKDLPSTPPSDVGNDKGTSTKHPASSAKSEVGTGRRKKLIPPIEPEAIEYFKTATTGVFRPEAAALMARKFIAHYQANGWVQNGNKAIVDWKAAANGWILRDLGGEYVMKAGVVVKSTESLSASNQADIGKEVEYFYQRYLENQLPTDQLKPKHYNYLKDAKITDVLTEDQKAELLNHAKQTRIKQISGTNERRLLDIMEAYQSKKSLNDDPLKSDQNILYSIMKINAIKMIFQISKDAGKPNLLNQAFAFK